MTTRRSVLASSALRMLLLIHFSQAKEGTPASISSLVPSVVPSIAPSSRSIVPSTMHTGAPSMAEEGGGADTTATSLAPSASQAPSPVQLENPTLEPSISLSPTTGDEDVGANSTSSPSVAPTASTNTTTSDQPSLEPSLVPYKAPVSRPHSQPHYQPHSQPHFRPHAAPHVSPQGSEDEYVSKEKSDAYVAHAIGWMSVLAVVGMIFTAYQIDSNPDGVCAG